MGKLFSGSKTKDYLNKHLGEDNYELFHQEFTMSEMTGVVTATYQFKPNTELIDRLKEIGYTALKVEVKNKPEPVETFEPVLEFIFEPIIFEPMVEEVYEDAVSFDLEPSELVVQARDAEPEYVSDNEVELPKKRGRKLDK